MSSPSIISRTLEDSSSLVPPSLLFSPIPVVKPTGCKRLSNFFGRVVKKLSTRLHNIKKLSRRRSDKQPIAETNRPTDSELDEAYQADVEFPQSSDDDSSLTAKSPPPAPIQHALPEILLMINDFLPPSSGVCLALTCKRLYEVLHPIKMNPAPFRLDPCEKRNPHFRNDDLSESYPERWILLQALVRDEPKKWSTCNSCLRLHRVNKTPRDVLRLVRFACDEAFNEKMIQHQRAGRKLEKKLRRKPKAERLRKMQRHKEQGNKLWEAMKQEGVKKLQEEADVQSLDSARLVHFSWKTARQRAFLGQHRLWHPPGSP